MKCKDCGNDMNEIFNGGSVSIEEEMHWCPQCGALYHEVRHYSGKPETNKYWYKTKNKEQKENG